MYRKRPRCAFNIACGVSPRAHPFSFAASAQSARERRDENQSFRTEAPHVSVRVLHAQCGRYGPGAHIFIRLTDRNVPLRAACRGQFCSLGGKCRLERDAQHGAPRRSCAVGRNCNGHVSIHAFRRVQIRCAECPEGDNEPKMEFCVECFSVGVEIHPHKARIPRVGCSQGLRACVPADSALPAETHNLVTLSSRSKVILLGWSPCKLFAVTSALSPATLRWRDSLCTDDPQFPLSLPVCYTPHPSRSSLPLPGVAQLPHCGFPQLPPPLDGLGRRRRAHAARGARLCKSA